MRRRLLKVLYCSCDLLSDQILLYGPSIHPKSAAYFVEGDSISHSSVDIPSFSLGRKTDGGILRLAFFKPSLHSPPRFHPDPNKKQPTQKMYLAIYLLTTLLTTTASATSFLSHSHSHTHSHPHPPLPFPTPPSTTPEMLPSYISPNATIRAIFNQTLPPLESRGHYGWVASFWNGDPECKGGYSGPRPKIKSSCVEFHPVNSVVKIDWGTGPLGFDMLNVYLDSHCQVSFSRGFSFFFALLGGGGWKDGWKGKNTKRKESKGSNIIANLRPFSPTHKPTAVRSAKAAAGTAASTRAASGEASSMRIVSWGINNRAYVQSFFSF